MNIYIVNGPNLNLVGKREPGVYGTTDLDTYLSELKPKYADINIELYQSNIEGELINKLQEVGFSDCGIVLNAGGYTHTSVALADCVAAIKAPVIEVHISNIFSREDYRRHSLLSPVCKAYIGGMGISGYDYALQWMIDYLKG